MPSSWTIVGAVRTCKRLNSSAAASSTRWTYSKSASETKSAYYMWLRCVYRIPVSEFVHIWSDTTDTNRSSTHKLCRIQHTMNVFVVVVSLVVFNACSKIGNLFTSSPKQHSMLMCIWDSSNCSCPSVHERRVAGRHVYTVSGWNRNQGIHCLLRSDTERSPHLR